MYYFKFYYLEDSGQSSTEWESNKTLHRLDGPAVEWANGSKKWYYKGKPLEHITSQEQYEKWLKLKVFW